MAGHAFADESTRGKYLVCVSVVAEADLCDTRKTLRELRASGARRIHMKNEGDRRRRIILSTLASLGTTRSRIYIAPRPVVEGRRRCLYELVADLAAVGVRDLTLEQCEHTQNVRDRSDLAHAVTKANAHLRYSHASPLSEACLWLPDVIDWAYGRGGDWRRRVEPLLEAVIEL